MNDEKRIFRDNTSVSDNLKKSYKIFLFLNSFFNFAAFKYNKQFFRLNILTFKLNNFASFRCK